MEQKLKKISLSIFIIFTLFLTSSCSSLSEFIIVNSSGTDIEVEYKVKNINNYEKPRLTDANNISGMSKGWKDIPGADLKIDQATGIINVKLPDGKALLVSAAVNYTGHDTEDFDIESIKITSGKSSILYTGKQTQKTFIKQENGDYVIFYR